jgi:ornithine cyclodeaminase/alanine dehydrogenase-like protein (mu-crystallin family)
MFGVGRFGIRAGPLALLFEADTWQPIAIMDLPTGDLRLSASVAAGAEYLARPDATRVAMIGSGGVALAMLRGLCAVRHIEHLGVWSRTPEHRAAFADHASAAFNLMATPYDDPEPMVADADIVAVGTNARVPLVRFDQLRPGTHVSSAGLSFELDISIYRDAHQLVAASRQQEVVSAMPTDTPGRVTGGPLSELLSDGRLSAESIIELGSIVQGRVAARNGPADINVYRESRGGVGDAALASRAYDLARERGLGVEIDLAH